MTIQQHRRAATTRDVLGGNKPGAKLPSEQTVTKEVNQMVHGIRCHVIRLGLSTREGFTRFTLKSPIGQSKKARNGRRPQIHCQLNIHSHWRSRLLLEDTDLVFTKGGENRRSEPPQNCDLRVDLVTLEHENGGLALHNKRREPNPKLAGIALTRKKEKHKWG